MKQDRFLIGILVFIGLLVVAALALFFVRQEAPAYGPEDSPEGVLQNYAVAVQKGDFKRAYGYLVDKNHKPAYDTFRQVFLTHQLDVSTTSVQVGKAEIMDSGDAWVEVTVVYAPTGPFSQGWSSIENATLIRQNGTWKITYMPSPYWGWDWYQPTLVK